jgi:hypothetical protein
MTHLIFFESLILTRDSVSDDFKPELDVLTEIHVPGLDLTPRRWNNHLILFEEVHENIIDVALKAWEGYQTMGRGSICLGVEDWRHMVQQNWMEEQAGFSGTYVSLGEESEEFDFERLQPTFRQIVESYDPRTEFVIAARHHPGDLLSCYLLTVRPSLPEIHSRLKEQQER